MRKNLYTLEQIDFLATHIEGTNFNTLTEMFNAHFGVNKTKDALKRACYDRKMYNRVKPNGVKPNEDVTIKHRSKTTFSVGHRPKNAFPAGNTPSNKHPVGYERVDVYGFVVVKVAEPNIWRMKHHAAWEEKNGPLPKGARVIFADGNKRNFNPENLIQITLSQFCFLKEHKLISNDAERNRTAVLLSKVATRAIQLKKQSKKT